MGNAQAKDYDVKSAATMPRGERVLEALLRENAEYVAGKDKWHGYVPIRRSRLASDGQAPLAAVVACADSRVPPELLFRASLGELFVIRAAGNTTWGAEVQGSIEYAVEHLHVPLVLVLGHTKCGAVGAACAGGEPLPGALGELVTKIAKGLDHTCHDVNAAVEQNVRTGIAALRANSDGCVGAAERRGDVVVRGGVYNIATGKVRVLPVHEEHEPENKLPTTISPLSVCNGSSTEDKTAKKTPVSPVGVSALATALA